jgi:hypothetical protein
MNCMAAFFMNEFSNFFNIFCHFAAALVGIVRSRTKATELVS